MFPNPSRSDPSRLISASRSFGGVAVLALAKLLSVMPRSLVVAVELRGSICVVPDFDVDPAPEA